jgi:hypothetical protein
MNSERPPAQEENQGPFRDQDHTNANQQGKHQ